MSDHILGGNLDLGDEEGLFLAVTAWALIRNRDIDCDKILAQSDHHLDLHLNLTVIFSLLGRTKFKGGIQDRWDFLEHPDRFRAALHQISRSESLLASQRRLERFSQFVTPELAPVLEALLHIDTNPVAPHNPLLEELCPEDMLVPLPHLTAPEERFRIQISWLARKALRCFQGRLGLIQLPRDFVAGRFHQSPDVSGREVWSLTDCVAPSLQIHGYAERTLMKADYSAEEGIASTELAIARWRREALEKGLDPDLEVRMRKPCIYLVEDAIAGLAFDLASEASTLTGSNSLLSATRSRLLEDCGGDPRELERRLISWIREDTLMHERGHVAQRRREEEILLSLRDVSTRSFHVLKQFVREMLAEIYGLEQGRPSCSAAGWAPTILQLSYFIAWALRPGAESQPAETLCHPTTRLLTFLAIDTDDPVHFMESAMDEVCRHVLDVGRPEPFLAWFRTWCGRHLARVRFKVANFR